MLRLFPALALAAVVFAAAQSQLPDQWRKPIKIRFGEPNVWSLDQAHYLLEQRFLRNHSLEATRPSADELNANAVHGNKVTALRQMLQTNVEFDGRTGLTNQLVQEKIAEELSARPARMREIEESFRRQRDISAQMAAVTGGSTPLTAEAQAQIKALEAQLDQEKRWSAYLGTLTADSRPKDLVQSAVESKVKDVGGATLDMFKDKFAFGDPKLAASNAIDNFINLQNEMIMKQVTLLRNEAGHNRRIVFAELPQAFEVEGSRWYRHHAENKLVQVQWTLDGYLYVPSEHRQKAPMDQEDMGLLRRQIVDVCLQAACDRVPTAAKDYPGSVASKKTYKWLKKFGIYGKIADTGTAAGGSQDSEPSSDTDKIKSRREPQGTLRTIDLVPRVSSLNINSRNYAYNAWNIAGIFRWLSGLGVNISYQRQKETFEQYLTQEITASSYGKGSNRFGWTFGPNPGTKALSPGQRTTYAIFSVPATTLAVLLKGKACVFDRRDSLKTTSDCSEEVLFPVPIPNEYDSGFSSRGCAIPRCPPAPANSSLFTVNTFPT